MSWKTRYRICPTGRETYTVQYKWHFMWWQTLMTYWGPMTFNSKGDAREWIDQDIARDVLKAEGCEEYPR